MSWTSGYHTRAHVRRPWGNGDGRFLYPPADVSGALEGAPVLAGPVDSIRIEQLRDGIEDYEYLCLLRRALDRVGARLTVRQRRRYASLLEVPETITRSMTDFARDGAAIEKRRDEIARALEELR